MNGNPMYQRQVNPILAALMAQMQRQAPLSAAGGAGGAGAGMPMGGMTPGMPQSGQMPGMPQSQGMLNQGGIDPMTLALFAKKMGLGGQGGQLGTNLRQQMGGLPQFSPEDLMASLPPDITNFLRGGGLGGV